MLDDRLKRQIMEELVELDQLLRRYANLVKGAREDDPELERITALGAVLHSFYSGLEKIFERVAKRVDGKLPDGDRWHTDLLIQMSKATGQRSPVISEKTCTVLQGYLAYRHYFRHSYPHSLEWPRMIQLVMQLHDTWRHTRGELEAFVSQEEGHEIDGEEAI